jgi:NhaP-type Na+/H+ or K+/H+ antiporter
VRNLVTIGVLISLGVTALAAHMILQMPWPLATLLGAVLSVTGPTVIGPLLRQIQPTGPVGPALRWEGIVIDPVGAVLALLVFEAIGHPPHLPHLAAVAAVSLGKTLFVGVAIGALAAAVLVIVSHRNWVADYLQIPGTLMLVVAAFTGANLLQDEAGLLAVTVMGVLVGNQRFVPFRHILEFKEALSILLVSSLFILMGARLDSHQLRELGWRAAAFIGALIVVGRPLSVWVCSIGTGLPLREQLFLADMAPRGVVAAAVSSIFALRLRRSAVAGAELIVPLTFAVIIVTVTFYGLTAPWLARRLGLSKAGAAGFVIAGAHRLARMIGKALADEGETVALVDTNRANVTAARLDGLTTYPFSVLSDRIIDTIEGTGIRQLLAMTPNEEVNSLAAVHFGRAFGRSQVYQLPIEAPTSSGDPKPTPKAKSKAKAAVSHELHGRVLFAPDMTYDALNRRIERDGAVIKRTNITSEFTFADYRARHPSAIPLFLRSETGEWSILTADATPAPLPGQSLLSLISASEFAGGSGERREVSANTRGSM